MGSQHGSCPCPLWHGHHQVLPPQTHPEVMPLCRGHCLSPRTLCYQGCSLPVLCEISFSSCWAGSELSPWHVP